MKPYFLYLFNKTKICIQRAKKRNISCDGMNLMGWNTRMNLDKLSCVHIGTKFITDGRFVLIADKEASVDIGDNVYFNEGGMVSSKGKIIIGSGCKFGPNVKIFDNNHKFDKKNGVSNHHSVGNIEIGSHCWIGANVTILKGAKIGDNTVIGANCVIDSNIPEGSIVTQNRDIHVESIK